MNETLYANVFNACTIKTSLNNNNNNNNNNKYQKKSYGRKKLKCCENVSRKSCSRWKNVEKCECCVEMSCSLAGQLNTHRTPDTQNVLITALFKSYNGTLQSAVMADTGTREQWKFSETCVKRHQRTIERHAEVNYFAQIRIFSNVY